MRVPLRQRARDLAPWAAIGGAIVLIFGLGYFAGLRQAESNRSYLREQAATRCAERGLVAFQNLSTGAVLCRAEVRASPAGLR